MEQPIVHVGVSVDGTWQRKGFTSLNGIITVISINTGKVFDYCNSIQKLQRLYENAGNKGKRPDANDKWNAAHKSSLTYKGSFAVMEKVSAEKIIKQSVTKHNLHYTHFNGDGDSKAFPAVENAYGPDRPVKKYEFIGHYQKRVGTRLQKKNKT